jgi:hypothetical protein
MSKTAAVIIGVSVLFVAVTINFAWWWFNTQGRAYMEDAMAAYKEGEAAGARTNEQGCMDAALATHRTPEGGGMAGSLKNSVRFSGCLNKASVLQPFCEGVPPPNEIMAVAKWSQDVCRQHGFSDTYCPQLIQPVTEYCVSPERAKKLKAEK